MLKLLELFGGIGACSKALERLGIEYKIIDYVEIDKYAVASYNAMHGTNFEPQDIMQWDKDINVDLIMHGSPCQDFSVAGKNAGGDEGSGTRSSLMYETIRIVEKLKPKYVVWENVKNLLSKKHRHNFDKYLETMEQLGYRNYYQVLNAKDYGIPQNRERVFTISIRKDIDKGYEFPSKEELKLKLKDMLEDEVDEKYYLSDKMIKYISFSGTKDFKLNDSKINLDVARPITTDNNKRAGTSNYLCNDLPKNFDLNELQIADYRYDEGLRIRKNGMSPTVKENHGTVTATNCNLRIRKLTPKECWRLMGFDDSDFDKAVKVNSNSQLYKQAGNSIVVNVLEKIFRNLLVDNENNEEKQLNLFKGEN